MKTTKELARELGLLRKRSVSSPGQKKNKRLKTSKQIFQYIIVLDFESTCWSDTKLIPQEIIEFPAVLMNTSNGAIESEFQYYIQPQERPILSEFCGQLTGITQKQVDDGIPLHFCLKRFSQWLEKLYKEKNIQYFSTPEQNSNLCTFVTWSDWDLGMCLKNECRRKQLRKPPELNQWIDLRATYKKFYERKPNGLNGALNDLGITFQGREHSGLDDSRNTACLAWRMIQDGCVLTITKCLPGFAKPVSVGKPSAKSVIIKEMPTFQNGARVNISDSRNVEKKNGFKIPLSIQGPKTEKRINVPNKSVILNNNYPLKISKSPLQSRFHEDSEIPQASSKLKDTFVPRSLDTNNTTINNCGTPVKILQNVGKNNDSRIPMPIQGFDTNIGQKINGSNKNAILNKKSPLKGSGSPSRSNFDENSKMSQSSSKLKNCSSPKSSNTKHATMNNNLSASSTSSLSKSTFINTFSTQTQSNHIQPKKSFTVYTDSENTNTKWDQVSRKDISFTTKKANVSEVSNCSKIISESSLAVKDISNTFITPNSLSMRSNSGTTFKNPSNNLSKMKSTPPLCKCGRRAKLSVSHTPGANMGRKFFTCSLRGSNQKFKNKSITSCNFFKWELGHLSSVTLSNQSLQTSYTTQSSFSTSSSFSNSAQFKENYNRHKNSTYSVRTDSAENTPILKKPKMRPYQLL